MKINRNNYEEFILDYYDGSLNPNQVSELFLFLKENPDIKEEFDSFENLSIVFDENIVFENKESLKKKDIIPIGTIDSSNYENYFVAELENDLTEKEANDVHEFLKLNPHLAETYHLLKLTKLKPDTSIVFENKEHIKKKEIISVGLIDASNYESFFIADFEKDLKPEEAQHLEQFLLQNNHLLEDYNLFKQTKLIADTSIVYENKTALKKFIITPAAKKKGISYQYISIAASILIIFGIYFLFNLNNKTNLTASNEPVNRENLFNNSLHNREYSHDSNINNEFKKQNKTSNINSSNYYALKTLQPINISHIAYKEEEDNLIAFRSSEEPITFNYDLLADNSSLPNNTNSESQTIKEFLISKFRRNVNKSNDNLNQPADRITGWDLAQAGVAGINKFTKNDLQLKKDASKPDNSYALIGKNFSISRNYGGK